MNPSPGGLRIPFVASAAARCLAGGTTPARIAPYGLAEVAGMGMDASVMYRTSR